MKKFFIILGSFIFAILLYFLLREKTQEGPKYTPYTIELGEITLKINASGVVGPENRLEIKPPIAGRIETILVEEGHDVKKGAILAWLSSTERAALLDSARGLGENEVKKWEELYRATPIIAPIAGTIIQKNVEEGQSFTNSDVIFAMSDRLAVFVGVDETDIAQVKIAGEAKVTLDAYPDTEILGKVSHIAYEGTSVNNVTTYKVNVIPDTIPTFMRSGMTVNVYFTTQQKKGVAILPMQAIQNGQVMLEDGTLKTIELGIDDGISAEILSGLSLGDTILIKDMQISEEDKSNTSLMLGPGRGGRRMRH